jgi:cell wall-associated NlpC family hydrolase
LNGQCEVFVENAYGTQYKYLTAQRAYDALHTSTTWTPDIGALVWFVPNSSNGGAGHVGIYIGNGQFISATYNGVKVQYMNWWSDHLAPYEGWGNAPTSWPGQ